MAKHLLINLTVFLLCTSFICNIQAKDCPSPSKMNKCSPRCYKDSDCASSGGKCCADNCNTKSCADPHMLGNGGSGDKYGAKPDKYGSGSVYCGNVKCSPFEKCGLDRSTKHEKCVRA